MHAASHSGEARPALQGQGIGTGLAEACDPWL